MTTPTIDKQKLLAKTEANLKRADALVKAFPMPAPNPSVPKPVEVGPTTEDGNLAIHADRVPGETDGVTALRSLTKNNARTALALKQLLPGVDGITISDACAILREQGERAMKGDLSELQNMLAVQAIALDGIFAEFVRRAALTKSNDELERMLRLAMKAQGQSRTSIESLAVIQQGPKIFAKQANVSNGGNQQVNNHASAVPSSSRARTVKEKPAKQTIPKVAR